MKNKKDRAMVYDWHDFQHVRYFLNKKDIDKFKLPDGVEGFKKGHKVIYYLSKKENTELALNVIKYYVEDKKENASPLKKKIFSSVDIAYSVHATKNGGLAIKQKNYVCAVLPFFLMKRISGKTFLLEENIKVYEPTKDENAPCLKSYEKNILLEYLKHIECPEDLYNAFKLKVTL
jgi:hypothetical protein